MKRNKTALVFGITLAIAAVLGACGNKKPMEMTLEESSVIDLHQTETTVSGGTVEARPEDIVNGYRFSGNKQILYCTAEEAVLRDRPGTDGNPVGKVKKGDALRCTAVNVRWLRFSWKDKTVYGAAEEFAPANAGETSESIDWNRESAEVGVAPN